MQYESKRKRLWSIFKQRAVPSLSSSEKPLTTAHIISASYRMPSLLVPGAGFCHCSESCWGAFFLDLCILSNVYTVNKMKGIPSVGDVGCFHRRSCSTGLPASALALAVKTDATPLLYKMALTRPTTPRLSNAPLVAQEILTLPIERTDCGELWFSTLRLHFAREE